MGAALAALLCAMMILAGASSAQAGSAALGRATAEELCANCHVVEGARAGTDAVQSLDAIANDPAMTPAFLRGFLAKPHGEMPDFQLTYRQIEDLVAYLESVRRR